MRAFLRLYGRHVLLSNRSFRAQHFMPWLSDLCCHYALLLGINTTLHFTHTARSPPHRTFTTDSLPARRL